ncbi:MAG: hypothetical protein ACTHJ4_07755, partial [Candidatus Nucleicultricaceae bacterium]
MYSKPLLALALLISVPTSTLMASCQVDMRSPFSDIHDVYGSPRSHILLTPPRTRLSSPFRELARRPQPISPSFRSKTASMYQEDYSDDDDFLNSGNTFDVRQQLSFSPIKKGKENQPSNVNWRITGTAERLGGDAFDLKKKLQSSINLALALTRGEQSLALPKDNNDDKDCEIDSTDLDRAFPPLKASSIQDDFLDQSATSTESMLPETVQPNRLIIEIDDETENSDDANELSAEIAQTPTLPKPKLKKAKKQYKKRSSVEIPAAYCAETIQAREGLTRSTFREKRR